MFLSAGFMVPGFMALGKRHLSIDSGRDFFTSLRSRSRLLLGWALEVRKAPPRQDASACSLLVLGRVAGCRCRPLGTELVLASLYPGNSRRLYGGAPLFDSLGAEAGNIEVGIVGSAGNKQLCYRMPQIYPTLILQAPKS